MGSGTNISRGIPWGKQAKFGSFTFVSAVLNCASAHGVNGGVVPFGNRAGWKWSIIHTPVRSGAVAAVDGGGGCAKMKGETKRNAAPASAKCFRPFRNMRLLHSSRDGIRLT